jgi:uncharacterized cupredoxin-like copper-binding protein
MKSTRFVVLAAAAAATLIPVGQAAAQRSAATATTVAVTAGKPAEFRFALSVKSVKRGTVSFKVTNKGSLPHDFKVFGKKTPLLAPGRSATIKVVFAKAGSYPYLCTVSGHAAAGMKGVLKVT